MSAEVFAFGGLGIRVESVEPSHLVWLAEFLCPHFEIGGAAGPGPRVRLVEDDRAYEQAFAAGPGDETAEAFALDTEIVRLPWWRGAERRLFDAEREVFYEVAADPLEVVILSRRGNWKARTALMRVVRELATNHAQRGGGLLLHASAFAAGSRGVVVLGAKAAGKTTLLIHALQAAGAEYVTNDRALVPRGPAPRARGVPAIVALRSGTLELFPALAERVAVSGYYQRLTLEECNVRPVPAAGRRTDAPRLSPLQLCRSLGVSARAECEIAALLFPRIAGPAGRFELQALPPAEAGARLEQALFGARPGRSVSGVFTLAGDGPAPDPATLGERCRMLGALAPAFECRLALEPGTPARAADELLKALLG